MLALDHRDSFKKLINPQNPHAVSDEQAIGLKAEIINALSDQFSGLLIDETYGLEAYPDHRKPFLLPLEKTGYSGQGGERITELEYRVTQLLVYGASGAKLLLYFNPHVDSAHIQIDTAKKALEECKKSDFPFFLESVTYQTTGQSHTQEPQLVLGSLKMLLENGVLPDVYKLEYPGNPDACMQITQMLGETPWILLTNPDDFDTFVSHLEDAVQAGCSGFLAGRALWQEVCSLEGEQKKEFLEKTLPQRFRRISKIVLNEK